MGLKAVSIFGSGSGGGGGGTPGGANNTIQFNSSGSLGGSANLTWDGANLQIGSSGRIKLSNGVTNYVAFNAPAIIPANVTWTLPSTDGTANQTLITNGSGVLSWATPTLTPVAPTNYALPVVSGTATVGQTLSCTTGGWNGYPAPTYAYQWVRGAATNISGATSSTYTLVDADYNNTVKCTVTATNSAGSASATSAATATVAGTVPGAPTIGTATAGNAQASVAFTAPAVTGGPAITSYTATSSPGGITGSAASSPITVSGLTNGTAYTFTVTATNSIGTGAASAASNSVTPSLIVQDPSFSYVPLLLETTSTNGQQNNTFLDSSTNNFTITRNGTPTQGSITPYWPNGQWSNLFNGSSDYLSLATSTAFGLGTGDLTIECWVYTLNAASGSNQTIVDLRTTNSAIPIALQINSTGYPFAYNGSANTSSTAISSSTWNHVALVRSGSGTNNCKLYLNGAQVVQFTDASNWGSTNTCIIARNTTVAVEYFNGYISNLRIVKGTAVYTSAFTPPTTPLTAITNTSLLTCQSNRFIDNSTNNFTITTNSTPRVQTFQPFSPAAAYTPAAYAGSGYFNGSTDFLSAPNNSVFDFGSGDFTLEFWYFPTAQGQSGYTSLISKFASSANYAPFSIVQKPSSYDIGLSSSSTGSSWNLSNATSSNFGTMQANAWNHIAVSRQGANCRCFVNGSLNQTSNFSTTALMTNTDPVYIGSGNSANTYATGYIGNLRIVKGTAVYTAAFTPPTAPVTAITNTSLLTNFTNAGIYDAAVQNNMITVGDAQASTTQSKWSPTSMKYDGTGDWLTAIDGPQLQLGTGDFTIEGWVYLSAVSVAYGILSKGTATTGWSANVTVLNKLQFSYTASNLTGTTSLATGTWYYFAIVRSGSATGNLKLYLNGSLEATSGGAVNDNFNQTNILYVGADRVGGSAFNGYLQDIRITKGVARTVTTTPTAAFPVQ